MADQALDPTPSTTPEPASDTVKVEDAGSGPHNQPYTVTRFGDETIHIVDDASLIDQVEPHAAEHDAKPVADTVPVEPVAATQDPAVGWYQHQLAQANEQIRVAHEGRRVADLTSAKIAHQAFEDHEKRLMTELKAAADIGDRGAEVELKDQIDSIRTERRRVGQAIGQLETQRTQVPQMQIAPTGPSTQVTTGGPLADHFQKNNAWMNDPKHKPKLQYLFGYADQLRSENKSPHDPKTYDLIAQHMAQQFPDIDVRDLSGNKTTIVQRQRGGQSRTPVSAPTGAGVGRGASPAPRAGEMKPMVKQMLGKLGYNTNDPEFIKSHRRHNSIGN